MQNAVVRRVSVPDLTTTVLTQTITGVAGDSAWAAGQNPNWRRRVAAIAAMLGGALVGGIVVLRVHPAAALGIAFAILIVAGLTSWRVSFGAPTSWSRAR
jgi:uncharacterized membrane protein YoaK (UPF0700 family)